MTNPIDQLNNLVAKQKGCKHEPVFARDNYGNGYIICQKCRRYLEELETQKGITGKTTWVPTSGRGRRELSEVDNNYSLSPAKVRPKKIAKIPDDIISLELLGEKVAEIIDYLNSMEEGK